MKKMTQGNLIAMVTIGIVLSYGCGQDHEGVDSISSDVKSFSKMTAVVDWQDEIEDFSPCDMVLDPDGNVYIAGVLEKDVDNSEYFTIKYDPNGSRIWSAKYSGFSTGLNMAEAIAIDDDRNVYVTGASHLDEFYDFATIKYSPEGQMMWVARYDGPAHDEDWAYDLKLDNQGNVYVMGESSNGSDVDVVTIKYDKEGRELWVARYDSGDHDFVNSFDQTLVVDSAGNVYSIGVFVLLKFDMSGNQLWAIQQQCNAIALDKHENIVQTSRQGTQLFSPDGQVLWQSATGGTELAVVPSKGIWVSSSLTKKHYDWHIQISRLSENGSVLWSSVYDSGYADRLASLAVDDTGNAYVTGNSDSRKGLFEGLSPDFITVKYNELGEEIWVKRRKNGRGESIGIDARESVYVTGFEGYTVKYSQEERSCGWWNMWCKNE